MKTTKMLTALAAALVLTACGGNSDGDTAASDLQGTSMANEVARVESEGTPEASDVEDEVELDETELEVEDELEDLEEAEDHDELDEVENEHDFAAGLQFMREEEKVARDVYMTFGDLFGMQIFFNIQDSEETHTTAIYDLLDKYDIPDPAYDTPIGVFTNPDLQAIYDKLVAQGSAGPTEALLVGAYIEEHDILDLDERINDDLPDDVRETYTSLREGSTNHLKAFVGNLERNGVNYEPQLMTVEAYEEALEN